MKVRAYEVFRRAIEEGVSYGVMRAFKHTATPSQELIEEQVIQNILTEVCEYFDFDDVATTLPDAGPRITMGADDHIPSEMGDKPKVSRDGGLL